MTAAPTAGPAMSTQPAAVQAPAQVVGAGGGPAFAARSPSTPEMQQAAAPAAMPAQPIQKVWLVQMTTPNGQALNRQTLNQQNAQQFKQHFGFTDQQPIVLNQQGDAFISINPDNIQQAEHMRLRVYYDDAHTVQPVQIAQLPQPPVVQQVVAQNPSPMAYLIPLTRPPYQEHCTVQGLSYRAVESFKSEAPELGDLPVVADAQGKVYLQINQVAVPQAQQKGHTVMQAPAASLQTINVNSLPSASSRSASAAPSWARESQRSIGQNPLPPVSPQAQSRQEGLTAEQEYNTRNNIRYR